jgi:hypothetical protein
MEFDYRDGSEVWIHDESPVKLMRDDVVEILTSMVALDLDAEEIPATAEQVLSWTLTHILNHLVHDLDEPNMEQMIRCVTDTVIDAYEVP